MTRSQIFPDAYVMADNKAPWADGYNDQRELVLEEFGPCMMNINWLKRILDVYTLSLPVKGGFQTAFYDTVIITSNQRVEEWYPGAAREDIDALRRRIEHYDYDNDNRREDGVRAMLRWRAERDTATLGSSTGTHIKEMVHRLQAEQERGNDIPNVSDSDHAPPCDLSQHNFNDVFDLDNVDLNLDILY